MMKPADLTPTDSTPQRALITSRKELQQAITVLLSVGQRLLRCLHRDQAVFELSSLAATDAMTRLLLAHRNARVRILVDDPDWLDTRAARLRRLQQRFPHALELRVASFDDPVGDDTCLIADDHAVLQLQPAATARGDLWLNNKPHAQPVIAGFDRRWEAAAHNLPVVPLGLG
jgi:hypothetical protein